MPSNATTSLLEDRRERQIRGLAILGDLMPGRHTANLIRREGINGLLYAARSIIGGRRVVANLECPLTRRQSKANGPALRGEPRAARFLADAGVAVVGLANNHVFDCAVAGFQDTCRNLNAAGVQYTGAGLDQRSACTPAWIDTAGGRFGIVAFSYSPAATEDRPGVACIYDQKVVRNTIRRARSQCDVLVVLAHAGLVLFPYPLPRDQRVYRRMIDYGADLVVGGHPHCVQPCEIYKGKHIFYSLGDCLFDHHRDEVWDEIIGPQSHPAKLGYKAERHRMRTSLIILADMNRHGVSVSWHMLLSGQDLTLSVPSGRRLANWRKDFVSESRALATDETVWRSQRRMERQLFNDMRKRGLR